MMKWTCFLRISIGLLVMVLSGCDGEKIPLADHPGAQIFHGVKRADVRCYRCHGATGQGGHRGPALIRAGETLPRDLFVQTVLDGRGNMPPFRSVLTEEEIVQIIDWLKKIPS